MYKLLVATQSTELPSKDLVGVPDPQLLWVLLLKAYTYNLLKRTIIG